MVARIVFVDEQNIDEVFCEEDSDAGEETSDSKSSEGEGDRSDEERAIAKKKEKKTTGLLAPLTRKGSTSQVIRAFTCSLQRILRSRTSFISSSPINI